jgi:hypothetical protein
MQVHTSHAHLYVHTSHPTAGTGITDKFSIVFYFFIFYFSFSSQILVADKSNRTARDFQFDPLSKTRIPHELFRGHRGNLYGV